MRRRRAACYPLRATVVIFLAVGIVDVTAGAGIAGRLLSGRHRTFTLSGGPLLPGASRTGHLTIAAPPVDATPYLHASHLRQRCATVCAASAPSLADVVTLIVASPSGATWHGPLAALGGSGVSLPGGDVQRGHSRRYAVTLSLPARAGNAYQGLVVSAEIEWGTRDAAGNPVTKPGVSVLGESFRRAPGQQPASLPFTGFAAALSLVAGLTLAGVGSLMVGVTRRRRHRPSGAR